MAGWLKPSVVYSLRQQTAEACFYRDHGVVLWQETTGYAVLVDRRDGRILWTYRDPPLPRRASFNQPLVVGSTIVIALPWEAELYEPTQPFVVALSADRGEPRWRVQIDGQKAAVSLHAYDGRLFGWGTQRGLFEIELHDGRLVDLLKPPVMAGAARVVHARGRFVRFTPADGAYRIEAYDATLRRHVWDAQWEGTHRLPWLGAWIHPRYVVSVGCATPASRHPASPEGYALPFQPADSTLGDRVTVFDLEDGRIRLDVRLPWHFPAQPLLEDERIRFIGRDTARDWFPVIDLDLRTGTVSVGDRLPIGSNQSDGGILGCVDGALIMNSTDFRVFAADVAAPKGRRWTLDTENRHCGRVVVDAKGMLACAQRGGRVFQVDFDAPPDRPTRHVRVQAPRSG
jgi:hypothetical protein